MPTVIARLRRDASGAAMVEFAMVLPLMMLLIAGVFSFGVAFYVYTETAHAARAAARYIASGGTCGACVQRAQTAIEKDFKWTDASGVERYAWNGALPTITVGPVGGGVVTVTATTSVSLPFLAFLGLPTTLPIASQQRVAVLAE